METGSRGIAGWGRSKFAVLFLLAFACAPEKKAQVEEVVSQQTQSLLSGIVAAYGFEEGAGTTFADASGNALTGTLDGQSWVTGKFGGALEFTGNFATVADANALDLQSALTVSAWVKPQATHLGWPTIVMKEGDAQNFNYALYSGWMSGFDVVPPSGVVSSAGEFFVATGGSMRPLGKWTHLASTYDGTELHVFVNGEEAGSVPLNGDATVSAGPLRIGGNSIWTNEFFEGVIDEVRVYGRALSVEELQYDMYTAVSDTSPAAIALVAPEDGATLWGTVKTAVFARDPAVSRVQFMVDGSPIGPEDTVPPFELDWDSMSVTNGAHILGAEARNSAGTVLAFSSVNVHTKNGLVAAYSFDEGSGTIAADASGSGHPGELSGQAWVPGIFGTGLDFSENFVTVPDSDLLDLQTAWTLAAWVKPEIVHDHPPTILMKEGGFEEVGYSLISEWDEGPFGVVPPSSVLTSDYSFYSVYGGEMQPPGAWTHLASTYDGTNLRIYVDGELANEEPVAVVGTATGQPLRIGNNSIWPNEFFEGVIDEVRIYNRALSQAELQTVKDTPIGGCTPVDDGNPCTIDDCDGIGTPTHTPVADGTSCADGNACTQTDTCQAGVCVGESPILCTALDACHDAGTCDPATGACSNPAKPDGALCVNATVCDGAETCQNGVCTSGTPLEVDDGNPCTADSCDAVAGVLHTGLPAGASCGSGRECSAQGQCECPPGACCDGEFGTPISGDMLDPTVATDFAAAAAPLYLASPENPEPPQQDVTSDIDPARVAVVLGRVTDRDTGAPIGCAHVTIVEDAGYGFTRTRADGSFAVAVNGGTNITVRIEATGYLSATRRSVPPWRDYTTLESIELVAPDPFPDMVVHSSSSTVTTVETSPVADESGIRAPKVSFPSGTVARLADGSTLSDFRVAVTEFTLGDARPSAMPAALPPNSGYTYAVDLSAEGAEGESVTFVDSTGAARPINYYVDNFLDMPNGEAVPTGYYDEELAQWVAIDSGRVISIVGIEGDGRAQLDVNTTLGADSDSVLAGLGITDEERLELARLYGPVGSLPKSIWRVQLPHFSTWDCNWPFGPPPDADVPPGDGDPSDPEPSPVPTDGGGCENTATGSIIGCESQRLGERIPIAGTPYSLYYDSSRQAGADRRLRIPLATNPAGLPSSLKRIELSVTVAGQKQSFSFTPPAATDPPKWFDFTWNGLDAFGRRVNGTQQANVELGYVYRGSYQRTDRFGSNGSGIAITGARDRIEVTLAHTWKNRPIQNWDRMGQGLGGWSLDVHHAFDPLAGQVVPGDGPMRRPTSSLSDWTITTIAGTGTSGFTGDGGPATLARINTSSGCADFGVGADGALYFTDTSNNRVRKIALDGTITTVAGGGSPSSPGYGDGGPATSASLSLPAGIAFGPAGEIYISDQGRNRVRVVQNGIIQHFAGNHSNGAGFEGDDVPADDAALNQPRGLAVGPDGSVYVADTGNRRVRRIKDGIITTVAGNGSSGSGGDGGNALQAATTPHGIAVGSDGTLYLADTDTHRVRAVGPDGTIRRVAGTGSSSGALGDGGLATNASLNAPHRVAVDAEGGLLIPEAGRHAVRRVSPTGIISTVAGIPGASGYSAAHEGAPATAARLTTPWGAGLSPDGSFYVLDSGAYRIRKVSRPHVQAAGGLLAFPSSDAERIYHFTPEGRHARTTDALTGATVDEFSYEADGTLAAITDGHGRSTQILRAPGLITFIAPDGQTTELVLGADGRVAELTNPANERYTFGYDDGGLLTSMRDPKANAENGNAYAFTYMQGRLSTDTDPLGNTQSLTYTPISNGSRVTRSTPLGRETTYETLFVDNSTQRVQNVFDPAGLQTHSESRADYKPKFASPDVPSDLRYDAFQRFPDGSAWYQRTSPDPRFGSNAPFVSETKRLLRANGTGLIQTQTTTRSYVLAADGLSVMSFIETTTRNGRASTSFFQRDAGGIGVHRRTLESPEGRTSVTDLSDIGLPLRFETPGFFPEYLAYDAAGRPIHHAQGIDADCANPAITSSTPTCRRSTLSYYGPEVPAQAGYLRRATDPTGDFTEYVRDALGRTLQEARNGEITNFGWDANGNLTSVTPPGQPAHSLDYSPVNLLTSYSPPPAGLPNVATSYTRDADRMLAVETRPGSLGAVTHGYDSAGRLDTITLPGGLLDYDYIASTASNAAGKTSSITGPYGVNLGFTHDGPLTTSTTWSGDIAGSVAWQYNNDFVKTRETVTGPNGTSFAAFGYDNDLLLTCASPTTCSPPGADALTLTRSPDHGLVTAVTLGSTSESWTYNGYGELASQSATFSSTPLVDITYDTPAAPRDLLGRVAQKTETIAATTHVYAYQYDAQRRLTDVTVDGVLAEEFTYDANGNRLTGWSPATGTLTGTYDDQDRLLTYGPWEFTYTANGELETKTNTVTNDEWLFQYDVLGNLLSVSLPNGDLVEYLVDALGRRVGKKVNGAITKRWIYRSALKPAAELDGAGNLVAQFVYGSKSTVPDYVRRGSATYRVVSDHLGSPRYVVNVTNASDVPFTASYSSFGEVTGTGLDWMPFGFAGGIYDSDTGLVRFGARDYGPGVGRWVSKDPLRFESGDAPNLYLYANGDPVNFIDQTGKQTIPIPWWAPVGGGAAAGAAVGGLPGALVGACVGALFLTGDTDQDAAPRRPKPNLNRCLDACAQGSAGRYEFCRSIRNPAQQARCWAVAEASEQECVNYCYSNYGN